MARCAFLGRSDVFTGTLAILALAACAIDRTTAPAPVVADLRTEVLWSTPGDERLGLFPNAIVGGAIEVGDEYWVGNGREGHILVLDRTGRALRTVGRRGNGPGEFPRGMTNLALRPDGRVAVYDVTGSIFVFAASGEFIERVALEPTIYNPKAFLATSDGFLITGGIVGNRHGIHRIGSSGALIESWHAIATATDPELPPDIATDNALYVAGGPLALAADGPLLYSESAPHRILRFVAGSETPQLIAQDPAVLESAVNTFTEFVDGVPRPRFLYPQSRAIYALDAGRILNIVTFEDDGHSLWQLYDSAGELLALGQPDRAYTPWSITRAGTVLVSFHDPVSLDALVAEIRWSVR